MKTLLTTTNLIFAILQICFYFLLIFGRGYESANVEINQLKMEQALQEWCLRQDHFSFEFINQNNPACLEYFPKSRMAMISQFSTNSSYFRLARKLKQMKLLVFHLQPEKRFARYCYYGCWCLADEGHSDFTPQMGEPVDPVDASCHNQHKCYQCAKMDNNENCIPDYTNYSYELHSDPEDPNNNMKNYIKCLDNPNNPKKACRRAICECDKKLAEDLRTNFGFWQEGHHQDQGNFDTSVCEPGNRSKGNRYDGVLKCCGSFEGVRLPFKTGRDNERACCGKITYDTTFQECCEDDVVKMLGSC